MDFDFSESQKILLNTARDFLTQETKNFAREIEKTEQGHSPELWARMADLGWMGLIFPEEYGGTGGDFLDLTLLIGEMGKALIPGPFISSMASGLSILRFGSERQREEYLPRLSEGKLHLAPALIQPEVEGSATGAMRAESLVERNGAFQLNGTRLFVPYAHLADCFIYQTLSEAGKSFFLIQAHEPGVKVNPLRTIASDRQGELILEGLKIGDEAILGHRNKGEEVANKLEEWGALFNSAFIMGMLERVLVMTVEHAKQREQFGKLIGGFQVIQHQFADMVTDVDKVKFLTYQAAWRLDEQLEAAKEIAMAKAVASDACRKVCLLGIKIHGGIGITEEHDMQLYFRMAKVAEVSFGDGDVHRERVAQQLGL